MLPTNPALHRFHHSWERFTFAPFNAGPPPPSGAAPLAAEAAHAAGPHPPPPGPPPPPHPHHPYPQAHPSAQGEYHAWRHYHRGFGRYRRGPSRIVWFGIGSLATLAYVKHKLAASTADPDGVLSACHWRPAVRSEWPPATSSAPTPFPPMPALSAPPAAAAPSSTPASPPMAMTTTFDESADQPALDASGKRFVPWSHHAWRRSREERRAAKDQRERDELNAEARERWRAEADKVLLAQQQQQDAAAREAAEARTRAQARVDAMLHSLAELKAQLQADDVARGVSPSPAQPTFTAQV